MERKIYNELLKWKNELVRKPLLLFGNRQIGKTYATIEFGEKQYKTVAYVNADNNNELLELVRRERTIDSIVNSLSVLTGTSILQNDTLIIIDNVNSDDIVKCFKKFGKEDNPYHVILITSFKEKINIFKGEELQYKFMHEMDFEEYLMALDKVELINYIKSSFKTNKPMPFHSMAIGYFNDYLMTGGLPEIVEARINNKSLLQIKALQEKVLDIYRSNLVSITNLIDIPRGNDILNSVPYQLLKNNKKFQYGLLKNGSRSKEYSDSIDYLYNNGIIYKCFKISNAIAPLSKQRDKDSFKLYLNDTGILYMMMHLNRMKLLNNDNYKNILYENSIASTLVSCGYNLYYYQSDGKAEISFIIQTRQGEIIPIEIVNKNLAKAKSLGLFMNKFSVSNAIRFTEDNFSYKKGIKYIPIYAVFCLKDYL